MKIKRLIPISFLITVFNLQLIAPSVAQNGYTKVFQSKYLKDLNGNSHTIQEYFKGKKAVVLVFLAAECPISQKYVPILRGEQKAFSDVQFLAIFTKWEKKEMIQTFLKEYELNQGLSPHDSIPVLTDKKNQLIKNIDARITPEVFLFTKEGVLEYRGAIDDWYYALGKYRQEPTQNYLKDAIISVLNNEPVKIKQTDAIGCIIEK